MDLRARDEQKKKKCKKITMQTKAKKANTSP